MLSRTCLSKYKLRFALLILRHSHENAFAPEAGCLLRGLPMVKVLWLLISIVKGKEDSMQTHCAEEKTINMESGHISFDSGQNFQFAASFFATARGSSLFVSAFQAFRRRAHTYTQRAEHCITQCTVRVVHARLSLCMRVEINKQTSKAKARAFFRLGGPGRAHDPEQLQELAELDDRIACGQGKDARALKCNDKFSAAHCR